MKIAGVKDGRKGNFLPRYCPSHIWHPYRDRAGCPHHCCGGTGCVQIRRDLTDRGLFESTGGGQGRQPCGGRCDAGKSSVVKVDAKVAFRPR